MKTKEEVINGFLERFCAFDQGTKAYNRIKSAVKGVWQCGFANGNEHVETITKAAYKSGYEEGERKHKTVVEEIFSLAEEKKKECFEEGYKAGYDHGYKDGCQNNGGYQRGHDEGFSQGRATAEADKTVAYQEGMDAVWKALMFWYEHDNDKRMKEFLRYKNMKDVVLNYSPAELIDRVEAYKEEQEKIKVGDEVIHKNTGATIVVTKVVDDYLSGFNDKGEQFFNTDSTFWEKTGRHFDELEILLKAMGEK